MAEVIAYLAERLNKAEMYIEKASGGTYYQTVDITCTVKREWGADGAGVLEINIPVPSDAPDWSDIYMAWSNIVIYDSTDGRYFVNIYFSILDEVGNSYIPGQTWKIYLVFPQLNYY